MIRELREEGATDVAGVMINHPLANGTGYKLDPLDALIPALQDTFKLTQTGYEASIGAMLGCIAGDELLLVDPQGRLHLKVTASPEPGDYDLTRPGPRETVKSWVRALAPHPAVLP